MAGLFPDRFQTFVGLANDLIDHVLDLVPDFPGGDLPIRARAFAHDTLDVRHLVFAPEFVHFRRNKFQDLVDQAARLYFAVATEIDQFPIESVARRAPAVFLDHAPSINAKRSILPEQFVQLDHDRLDHGGERDRVVDPRLGIADAELESVEEGMQPDVPPDLFRRCRCNWCQPEASR